MGCESDGAKSVSEILELLCLGMSTMVTSLQQLKNGMHTQECINNLRECVRE